MGSQVLKILVATLTLATPLWAQTVVFENGRIETVSGKSLEVGKILVKNGKIVAVGEKVNTGGAKTIDLKGRTLMPGMVTVIPHWGHPNQKANSPESALVRGYNPYDENYRKLLEQGWTTVSLFPRGAGIPGQGMTLRPGVLSFRRSMVQTQGPLVVYLSSRARIRSRSRRRTRTSTVYVPTSTSRLVAQYLALAKRYLDRRKKGASKKKPTKKAPPKKAAPKKSTGKKMSPAERQKRIKALRLRMAPFIRFLMGRQRMLVICANAAEVLYLKALLKPYAKYPYRVLLVPRTTGHNLYQVLDQLDSKKFSVLDYLHLNPYNYYQSNFQVNTPAVYLKHGFPLTFRPTQLGNSRKLAFQMAFLYRLGLPRPAILKSLTLNPARALGVQKICGSLDKGKRADFVVWSGDPLTEPAEIDMVIRSGKVVYQREKE